MAAEVAQKIRQVKFVVVGKYSTRSRYYKYLVRLRHQLGLDDRVVFTGVVEPIHAVMERLHLLVVSSNTESLGLVILEAMALGKPVVAFRVGGIPEVVEDGVTGRLVKFGDCHAMAGAVASLLEDPKMSACMGAAGRARVEKDFNVFIQSEQIEATLLNVLTG
jgi:glycosyltransferase involved in cell wall biosynthesis